MVCGRDAYWLLHFSIYTLVEWYHTGGNVVLKDNSETACWDRTAKSRLSEDRISESQCADDIAVYATTRKAFDIATSEFIHAASIWGLSVSDRKTKNLVMGRHLSPTCAARYWVHRNCSEIHIPAKYDSL